MSAPSASSARTLNTFLLSMMTLGLIVGIPLAADLAKDGPAGITIILFGFLVAFLPSWLVCSELATMFPHDGGVYLWVKEAFGGRWGFQAIWMQWSVMMVFLTASLSVAAASLTFLFGAQDTLADNRLYLGAVILAVIWLATAANTFGVEGSARFATGGVILATIVPAVVVIVMGVQMLASGGTLHLETDGGRAFFLGRGEWDLLLPGYTAFLGLEITAVFVRRLRAPNKQYPRALLIAGVASVSLLAGVALTIMAVLPTDQISSEAGIMSTLAALSNQSPIGWLMPLAAASIAFGWVGLASNIFIGPATGLLATARYGHLPAALTRENRAGAPIRLLLFQALIASAIALTFVSFQNTQVAFSFVVALATMMYAIVYILMYAAVVRLRRSKPDLQRPFHALGRRTLWLALVCGWAIAASLAIIVIGFVPPSTLPSGTAGSFTAVLAVAFAIMVALPFLVNRGGNPKSTNSMTHVAGVEQGGEVFLDETPESDNHPPK
jgi:amino acid transporter